MRKKYLRLVFAVIVLLIAGMCLVACGGGGGEPPKTDDSEANDGGNTAGWSTVSDVVEKDMYQSLLFSATNMVYELSKDKLDANKAVTMEGKVGLKLNGKDLWLSAKGKYDQTDPTKIREKTMLAIELYTDEALSEEKRQVGVYVYMDELYLSLGENKVKFSLRNSQWTQYFPFDIPDITSNIANIASFLPQYIKLTSVNAQYRRNSNKEEYKYDVDVNVSQTIKGLCAFVNNEQLFTNRELATTIKEFAADVLNITVAQLEQGEVSDSSLGVDFMISGNQLQGLNANAKIALGAGAKNLIGADELNIDIDVKDLVITNNYAKGTTIPFVNDTKGRQKYVSYSEAIYLLKVPVKQFDENYNVVTDKYNLEIMTRIFQDDSAENFFTCEYCDRVTGKAERAVYFYGDVLYLYEMKDGVDMECICSFDVNLSELATNILINNLVDQKSELDVYGLVAYILKNLSLSEKEISFALNKDFYTKVWYNFYDMLTYVNSFAPENMFENEEVVAFIRYITDTAEIVSIEFNNDDIVNIIKEDDEKISSVAERLAAESEE